jgi:hypothetical protein
MPSPFSLVTVPEIVKVFVAFVMALKKRKINNILFMVWDLKL